MWATSPHTQGFGLSRTLAYQLKAMNRKTQEVMPIFRTISISITSSLGQRFRPFCLLRPTCHCLKINLVPTHQDTASFTGQRISTINNVYFNNAWNQYYFITSSMRDSSVIVENNPFWAILELELSTKSLAVLQLRLTPYCKTKQN